MTENDNMIGKGMFGYQTTRHIMTTPCRHVPSGIWAYVSKKSHYLLVSLQLFQTDNRLTPKFGILAVD